MAAPSPSRKKVSDIKTRLLQPALTSHFQCWFNPPTAVRDFIKVRSDAGVGIPYDNNSGELFSLLCSEASLPGSSLATHELNNDFTGVTERHAYRRLYDDRADFTFYVDHDHNIIKFFENWISYIVGEEFAEGIENPDYFYRVNYPNTYRTEIYLHKFERDYSGRYTRYRFLQAYPISITSMPVSYDSSSLLKCTVSFTYTRYLITGETNTNSQEFITSFTGSIPTAEEQAQLNGSFGLPVGSINYESLNTTGGVPFNSASASGNTIGLQQSFTGNFNFSR